MTESTCRICNSGRTTFVCAKVCCQKAARVEDRLISALAGAGWLSKRELMTATVIPRNALDDSLVHLEVRSWIEQTVRVTGRSRANVYRLTPDGAHAMHATTPQTAPESIGDACEVDEVTEKVYCHMHLALTGREVEIVPGFTGWVHKGTGKDECDGLPDGRSGHATPARDLTERTVVGPRGL